MFIGASSEAAPLAEVLYQCVSGFARATHWKQWLFVPGRFPLADLHRELQHHDFAIFVATPDDPLTSGAEVARDHVLFEFGMFVGLLGRSRSFLVLPRGTTVVIPADLHDLGMAEYDETRARLGGDELVAAMTDVSQEIRKRLAPQWLEIVRARSEQQTRLTTSGEFQTLRRLRDVAVHLRETLMAVQRDVFVVHTDPDAFQTLKERAVAQAEEVVASLRDDAERFGVTEALQAIRDAAVDAVDDLSVPVGLEEPEPIRRPAPSTGPISSMLRGKQAPEPPPPPPGTGATPAPVTSLHRELLRWWEHHGPRFEASTTQLHDALLAAALRLGVESPS